MTTGFDRLRPTATPRAPRPRAMGLRATSFSVVASLVVTSLGVASLVAVSAGTRPASAADDASRWDGDARSAVRLIAGAPSARNEKTNVKTNVPTNAPGTAMLRAGIEVRLKAGWHTYWRYPGDAGVPPRFDFAGSQNVKSVDVLWPAPQPIREQALVAIGYASDVIWPLVIVPQDPSKPVTLRLKLDYAVCEKLCVPAEAKGELVLAGGPSSREGALAGAEARVPKKLALGEGSSLAVQSVRRIVSEEAGVARPRVIVDVAAPSGSGVALFAEGPAPDWALPVPAAIDGAPAGLQRFAFDLDGAPPGGKYQGVPITLTAVAGNSAIEVVAHLD
jgi:DsbC/DsbD-like thiol-disulfide interchange protein